MDVTRRRLLVASAAGPMLGAFPAIGSAAARPEATASGITSLIGIGAYGKRLVSQVRARFPEIARRINTSSFDFPPKRGDANAEAVNDFVSRIRSFDFPRGDADARVMNHFALRKIGRLICVKGRGESAEYGPHGRYRTQCLSTDDFRPYDVGCVSVLPFDSERLQYDQGIAETDQYWLIPTWQISVFEQYVPIRPEDTLGELLERVDQYALRLIASLM